MLQNKMKKHNSLQNKELRNYDNYDPNKVNKRPSKQSVHDGIVRRKIEDILEQKEFNKEELL